VTSVLKVASNGFCKRITRGKHYEIFFPQSYRPNAKKIGIIQVCPNEGASRNKNQRGTLFRNLQNSYFKVHVYVNNITSVVSLIIDKNPELIGFASSDTIYINLKNIGLH